MFLDKQNNQEVSLEDLLRGSTGFENEISIQDEADAEFVAQELEESWGRLHQAVMKAEFVAHESNDEVLYEASISEYWYKVVDFFKQLWEAVKQFFSNIWMKISSLWANKKKWVQKYKKRIKAGESKLIDGKIVMKVPNNNKVGELIAALETHAEASREGKSLDASQKFFNDTRTAIEKEQQFVNKELNATHLQEAIKTVEEYSEKASKGIKKLANNEIDACKRAIAAAQAAARETKGSTEKYKKQIDMYRLKVKMLKYARSKKVSTSNAQVSYAFAICKKAASLGSRTTKQAFDKGYKAGTSKIKEDSILSQFGLND